MHLLTSGDFKRETIHSQLKKLAYPSIKFFQEKILATQEEGLSRIEYSSYNCSQEEYFTNFVSIDACKQKIDKAFDALNIMKETLYYKISL